MCACMYVQGGVETEWKKQYERRGENIRKLILKVKLKNGVKNVWTGTMNKILKSDKMNGVIGNQF